MTVGKGTPRSPPVTSTPHRDLPTPSGHGLHGCPGQPGGAPEKVMLQSHLFPSSSSSSYSISFSISFPFSSMSTSIDLDDKLPLPSMLPTPLSLHSSYPFVPIFLHPLSPPTPLSFCPSILLIPQPLLSPTSSPLPTTPLSLDCPYITGDTWLSLTALRKTSTTSCPSDRAS